MRCKLFVFSAACSNYTPSSYCFWTKITKVRNSFDEILHLALSGTMETATSSSVLHLLYSCKWIEFNRKKKPWTILQRTLFLASIQRKNRPLFIVLEIRKLSKKNTTKSNDRVNLIVKYIRMTLNPVRLLCYNAWFFPNHSGFRCFSFLNVHGHWFDEEEKLPCDAMRMQIIIIECAMNYLVNLQNLNWKHAKPHY